MRNGRAFTACLAGALWLGPASAAEPVTPGQVKFVENEIAKSLTGSSGDPVAGRKWIINRQLGNCLACHKNSMMNDQLFHGEVGPPLDGAGSRWTVPQLRAIVANSKQVFGPDTLMPAFYRNGDAARTARAFKGKTILSAQQVEDVVAYLSNLKDPQ